jgi:hypothetical protein
MALDTITAISANGAIAAADGVAKITQATEGAYTLANPAAQAGAMQLQVVNASAVAQDITGTFKYGWATYTKLRLCADGMIALSGIDQVWYIRSLNRGVTLL